MRQAARGFTLLEVGLAMTISLLVLAGVAAFYKQVQDDAGDACMRSRIASLGSVVEGLYAANGVYPDGPTLWPIWAAKRPDDASKSAWGGDVWTDQIWAQSGVSAKDIDSASTGEPYAEEGSMTSGGLYYYRVTTGGLPAADGQSSLYDMTVHGQVTIRGYGLAGLKTKNRHFMVTSGR